MRSSCSGPHGHVEPARLKRAVDFIEAHLHRSITLSEITGRRRVFRAAPCTSTSRTHRGVSPMRYLHDARFARVRADLLRARHGQKASRRSRWNGASATSDASRSSYRNRFGETPSQTAPARAARAEAERRGARARVPSGRSEAPHLTRLRRRLDKTKWFSMAIECWTALSPRWRNRAARAAGAARRARTASP